MAMKKSSSAVYNINYHLVWCPKYRRDILQDEVADFVNECIQTIAATNGWEILELRVMPDHIHLFISAPPFVSPTAMLKILKGTTALRVFKRFPELYQRLRKGNLWSPSYYVGTAGHVSAETIQRYIEEQGDSSTD
jgi:putative transposase